MIQLMLEGFIGRQAIACWWVKPSTTKLSTFFDDIHRVLGDL